MKQLLFISGLLLVISSSQAQNNNNANKKESPAKILKETSYAYGYNFASDLISNENFEAVEKSTKEVLQGMKDGLQPDSAQLADIVTFLMKRIDNPEATSKTPTEAQEMAYKLGYNAVGNLVSLLELEKEDLYYSCIKKGYTDFAKGKKPQVAPEKQSELLAAFFKKKQALAEEKAKARYQQQAQENLALAQAFLKENAQKPTIQTTPSGLQYQVIKEGTGLAPSINSTVKVHYTGTLINGKVFDSSIERGEPTQFKLSAVIEGWQEGLGRMKEGARYQLFIPPSLAYGTTSPAVIPPNSLLIFDVELLEVVNEVGVGTDISKLSYAYGYTVGTALVALNLTEEETNVEHFVRGFEQGFEANPRTVQELEKLIKARLASQVPSPNAGKASQIARGIGYTSAAGLVQQAQAQSSDFDSKALAEGYQIGLQQQEALYTIEDMNQALEEYANSKKKIQEQAPSNDLSDETMLADNLKRGTDFLTQNVQKEGVIALPSGLQYKVIQEGTGLQPTLNSTVTTHYKGTLIDGTVFDSSYKRGQPATFPLKAVIQGWQEGIPLMKKGAKYQFFIPAHLGYGNRAAGSIPAGSTLIFEVELLEVD